MVLLIPKRIKQIKDEGRREGIRQGIEQGLERGQKEERQRIGKAIDRFKRGEIAIDELKRLVSNGDDDVR